MSDQIDCCPKCRSSALRRRNPGHPHSPRNVIENYRCKDCGNEFNTPDRRRRTTASAGCINNDTVAKKLLDADPDDVDILGGEEA